MIGRTVGVLISLALLACSCTDEPLHAHIGKTMIPQATDLQPVTADMGAATVEFNGGELSEIPKEHEIRLAIGRDVPWGDVMAVSDRLTAEGRVVVYLVGKRRKVGAFRLSDELEGDPIRVFTNTEGKACVSPPGVAEAKCVQRGDKKHISRAFVRELVREAIRGYKIEDIIVEIPDRLGWADGIRAIDGARTCCKDVTPRVAWRGY